MNHQEREPRPMLPRIFLAGLMLLQILGAAVSPARATDRTVVGKGEISHVLTEYVRNRTANLGVEVSIRSIDYNGDVLVPAGKVDFEVIAPSQWEGWGSANLALIVRVNGRLERNVPVRVEVEALGEVVVAARPLGWGEVIGTGDVALQKRDLAKVSGRVCRTLEEVLGKRARIGIRGNTPLRADYLERVPLVKSGQLVTIILENDNLRLTARGKAKNAGAEGETVLVQNVNSLKEISARVVDVNTVKVEF